MRGAYLLLWVAIGCQPTGPSLYKVPDDPPSTEMAHEDPPLIVEVTSEEVVLPLRDLPAPQIEPLVGEVLFLATGSSLALSLDVAPGPSIEAGLLADADRLEVVRYLRRSPLGVRRFEQIVVAPTDRAAQGPTPIADLITHSAAILEDAIVSPAVMPDRDAAMLSICDGPCAPAEGELPADLALALTPILTAAASVIEARVLRDGEGHTADWWVKNGADALAAREAPRPPNPADATERAYLLGGRSRLYAAASALASAIESADLSRFAGKKGIHYRLTTPHGVIAVEDAHDQRYDASDTEWLFLLDLGGDDVYLDRVAANRSAENAVSVLIDLGGDDRYSYPEAEEHRTWSADHLPADAAGRGDRDGIYEAASLSRAGRQASAANGVAMLFDLGGDDRYFALQGSQAFAEQGVAVLYDADGDDEYVLEALGQGAAVSGIGLLYDRHGDDRYESVTRAQGFGFVAGLGLLYEAGGDDHYDCVAGSRIYPAPQDERLSASFCQGAALGLRVGDADASLAGGVGILRDRRGDDDYHAGAFGQGVGYWEGLGILAEGEGDDRLDVRWYGAGAGVHYGLGLYLDAAGADETGVETTPINMILGAGHDFGLGIAFDQAGDDERRLPASSGGAASASGLGIFVDAAGDDQVSSSSERVLGAAVADETMDAPTIGVFLDGNGDDRYSVPGDRGDDAVWSGVARGDGAGAAGADARADLGLDLRVGLE